MTETIIFLIILFIFLALEYFWIRQLIYSIRQKNLKWIIIILFFNFIGAAYYWRLKKMNKVDSKTFHRVTKAWVDSMGFSIEKSREVLSKIGLFSAKYLSPLIFPMIVLNFIGEYGEISPFIGIPIYIIFIGTLLLPIYKITQVWRRDDIIVPFLSTIFFWTLSGKDYLPTNKDGIVVDSSTIQNKPYTLKSQLRALLMGDFFLIISLNMIVFLIYTAISPEEHISDIGGVGVYIAGLMVFFIILFIGILFNMRVIYYNKPDYLLHMMGNYAQYKWLLYGFLMLIFVGLFIGMGLLPFTFEN